MRRPTVWKTVRRGSFPISSATATEPGQSPSNAAANRKHQPRTSRASRGLARAALEGSSRATPRRRTSWRWPQSPANPSPGWNSLLTGKNTGNSLEWRAFAGDSRPNSARGFGHLDENSLQMGTGSFLRPNRELIREIREFEAENRERRRATRWPPFFAAAETRCHPRDWPRCHSTTTATQSVSAGSSPRALGAPQHSASVRRVCASTRSADVRRRDQALLPG
jgi:hypothetical protein